MLRTTSKSKGHKTERTQYFIPYHTDSFFVTAKKEEGEVVKEPSTTKFPIQMDPEGGDTRTNTTYVKVNNVDFFDSEPEKILNVYSTIQQRLIKPKNNGDEGEDAKQFLHLLRTVCSDTARSTLDSVTRNARQELWDKEFAKIGDLTYLDEEIVENEQTLHTMIDGTWTTVPEGHDNVAVYRKYLKKEYLRYIMNGLHGITFGADAYRAHKVQHKYLREQIRKPYEVSVEAAFRRVEVLTNMMAQFPPTARKGKPASAGEWELFNDTKKLNKEDIREIKFNLLPVKYQEHLENLEQDWSEMTAAKFLSETQKCELKDRKEQEKRLSEKAKKSNSRSEKKSKRHRNGGQDDDEDTAPKSKKYRNSHSSDNFKKRETTRKPQECILCKLAGAPEVVYQSHSLDKCKRIDQHTKKLAARPDRKKGEFRKAEHEDEIDGEVNAAMRDLSLEKKHRGRKSHSKKHQYKRQTNKKKKKKKRSSGYDTSTSFWSISSLESDF